MRTTVPPEPTTKAKKHPRADVRSPALHTLKERRSTSIFVDRRHQSR